MFISFALIVSKSIFTETTKAIMKAPDAPIASHRPKTIKLWIFQRKDGIKVTLDQLKTRAKAHDLMIRKDGKGGYLQTDFLNRLMAPGPMTLEEVEMWLDDLDEHQQ